MKTESSPVGKTLGASARHLARRSDPASSGASAPASSPGRPRDPRIDAAILSATADLLVATGYAGVTMAAIAERAGTTKTALYRRWTSKADVIHEAVFPTAPTALGMPYGDIAADVRAMIGAARDVFSSPPSALRCPACLPIWPPTPTSTRG